MSVLDLAVLRTFVSIVELGSFAKGAHAVGRSESAVSQQIKRLEDQIGQEVFRKAGRTMALTAAGQLLLGQARQLLAMNDETMAALARERPIEGRVRLGAPQDIADTWLPAMLARFAYLYPTIEVQTQVARSGALQDRLARGELDLALAFSTTDRTKALWSADLPMCWIGRPDFMAERDIPVPLAVFDPPCTFRSSATGALDRHGFAWRVTFASGSLAGLWSAVSAGLGVTVRTPVGLPPSVTVLGGEARLPDLPALALSLHAANQRTLSAATDLLRQNIVEGLENSLVGAF